MIEYKKLKWKDGYLYLGDVVYGHIFKKDYGMWFFDTWEEDRVDGTVWRIFLNEDGSVATFNKTRAMDNCKKIVLGKLNVEGKRRVQRNASNSPVDALNE